MVKIKNVIVRLSTINSLTSSKSVK